MRLPGQSLEEEWRAILQDKLEPWLLTALLFVVLAAFEWWRFLRDVHLNPILFSLVAGLAVLLAAWRVMRWRPQLKALRLGIQGEKVVGQYLEQLRSAGYAVFHDVIAEGFNVDHVLIGPAGVFVIETKTWNKPSSDAEVHFDGEQLKVGNFAPDRDPVKQAQATARWLTSELLRSTGKDFAIWPVVLFPGWFVRQSDTSLQRCWVLEPKALPSFLSRAPERMSREDIRLASYHLSRIVRVSERERART